MALSNYTELQAAIVSELRRTDLTANIPDFITRAEAKINRKVRLRGQEDLYTWTYDTAATDKFLSLPAGFVELLSLKIKGSTSEDRDYRELRYIEPSRFHLYYIGSSGKPERYTLRNKIEIDRLPGESYTVRMHYLKQWDIATDTTNWLLTNYPDAYLYGSLAEASLFIKHDSRVPIWKSLFEESLSELDLLDERSRNDAVLDTHEYTSDRRAYGYRIVNDNY